jgi:precorrin-6B methylase 2
LTDLAVLSLWERCPQGREGLIMNKNILTKEVQAYINANLDADVNKIALAKSPFPNISAAELANQITAKKKSKTKLPTWFNKENIYYPSVLSIEQTSSEQTAIYKASLTKGEVLIDVTAGLGVDSYYFAKKAKQIYSCEINRELSQISAYNAELLNANNITCLATDGLEFIKTTNIQFNTVYVDPARRSTSGKVFKLSECTPNIVAHLADLLALTERVIIKTSPLLDITAGLAELKNVSEIHIVSVKNECKELLWVLDKDFTSQSNMVCATLNNATKTVAIPQNQTGNKAIIAQGEIKGYLYEPDVALMKSGAFDWIANQFDFQKLENQSHLYLSDQIKPEFLGRIFDIKYVMTVSELKKSKQLTGNVIVRNFPEKAENLVKKYKITPSADDFLIFTKGVKGYMIIVAKIIQYY